MGCLVFLVLIVGMVYVGTKAVPVYLDKMEFEEGMARIASQAGVGNLSNREVKTRVTVLGRLHHFQIPRDGITVNRSPRFQGVPEISIEVSYRRSVEFPGYLHTFLFTTRVSSIVGRL